MTGDPGQSNGDGGCPAAGSDQRGDSPQVPWWGAVLLVVLAVAGMYVALGVAAWLRTVTGPLSFGQTFAAVQQDMASLAFAQLAGFGTAALGGLRIFGSGSEPAWIALGLTPVSWSHVGLALVAGVGLQFLLAEVGNLAMLIAPVPLEARLRMARLVAPDSLSEAIPVIVTVVLTAPLTEEALFRGLLFRGLRGEHGVWVAGALSALLFGAAHFVPAAIIFAGVGGAVFAWVVHHTGSVTTTLAMHMAVNAAPLLLPERVLPITGFNTTAERIEHSPLPILAGAAMVTVASLWLLIRSETRPRSPTK